MQAKNNLREKFHLADEADENNVGNKYQINDSSGKRVKAYRKRDVAERKLRMLNK